MSLDLKDKYFEAIFEDLEINIGNMDYFKSRIHLDATK